MKLLRLRQRDNESIAAFTVRFREEFENQALSSFIDEAWRDHFQYLSSLNGKMQTQMPTLPEYKGIEKESFCEGHVEFAKRVEESIRASDAASSSRQAKLAVRAGSETQGSSSAGGQSVGLVGSSSSPKGETV